MITAKQYDENVLTNVCLCGERGYLVVDEDKIMRLLVDDDYVQNVLPDYPSSQREFIMSGMCPKCQRKVFDDESAEYVEGRWFNEEMMGGLMEEDEA